MGVSAHIPTEVLQCLTPSQAWEYRLVPFSEQGQQLVCYGEQGRDYTDAIAELEVLTGRRVSVEELEVEELQKLLGQYYRKENASRTAPDVGLSLAQIGGGQGFLMGLIDEAFASYASDIHFEPYEERCRIRMRIDGRLVERYVIDRQNYALESLGSDRCSHLSGNGNPRERSSCSTASRETAAGAGAAIQISGR